MCQNRFNVTEIKKASDLHLEKLPLFPFINEHFIFIGSHQDGYSYVAEQEGYISIYTKKKDTIAFSEHFSGCAMAQFTYEETTYFAHIYLYNDKETNKDETRKDTREYWNRFIDDIAESSNNKFHDFILFNPYKNELCDRLFKNNSDISHMSAVGIIDTHNLCFCGTLKVNRKLGRIFDRPDAFRVPGVLTNDNKQVLIIPQPANDSNE